MRINFIGNFAHGYVGEVADETHLALELELLGHTVVKVPRDQWKAFVDGETPNADWVLPKKADLNIIAKWDFFDDAKYIKTLKVFSQSPVFYWVWDYMFNPILPSWHIKMVQNADLYLSGELGMAQEYKKVGGRPYYFQFDVCDVEIPKVQRPKKYDLVFTGSHLGQGNRIEFLKEINDFIPVKIFSWNYKDWQALGFDASPAVYGAEYNEVIAKSKVILGMSVEPHCWGYWSNRVGKVIVAGGRLLQQYAPGMEQLLPRGVEYFSSAREAIEKAQIMINDRNWYQYTFEERMRFSSREKVRQLVVLAERFIKENNGELWKL